MPCPCTIAKKAYKEFSCIPKPYFLQTTVPYFFSTKRRFCCLPFTHHLHCHLHLSSKSVSCSLPRIHSVTIHHFRPRRSLVLTCSDITYHICTETLSMTLEGHGIVPSTTTLTISLEITLFSCKSYLKSSPPLEAVT